MDSIKFAEQKLGHKMDTPKKNAPDGHSPVSYDIESAGSAKFDSKVLDQVAETGKSGDSDINTYPKGY